MKYKIIFKALDKKEYLYHATFKKFLPLIMQHGLGAQKRTLWSDSKLNTVYLSKDLDVAVSYAEVALDFEENEDLNYDDIIVLKIDSSKLDRDKLFVDSNVTDNKGDTLEYHGIIPFDIVEVIK